jgi:hypothetical protein
MLKKITAGFVIQEFDPDLKKFVSQEFTCGDEVTYEDTNVDDPNDETDPQNQFVANDGTEPYLPYMMYQPGELDTINELIDSFDGKCPENIDADLWKRLRGIVG